MDEIVIEQSSSRSLTSCIFVVFVATLAFYKSEWYGGKKKPVDKEKRKKYNLPPGPKPLPVLGSLHLMGQYDVPFEAFTELSREYGDIFSVRLGATDCVVVNNVELRDEVLTTKASDVDGRPEFERFNRLFGNDKQNGETLYKLL